MRCYLSMLRRASQHSSPVGGVRTRIASACDAHGNGNAEELITKYTRLANSARRAKLPEIPTEIVGGADALSAS